MRVYEMDEDDGESLAEMREFYRDFDAERFNTPVGKFAPSDFVYDPLRKAGAE